MTLVMLANGDDPAKVTDKTWNAAFDRVKKAVDNGQIRRFTGNDYAPSLANGDLSAAMSWSGDISQIGNKHIHWNVPKDGGAIWTDNMLIPKGGDVYTASVYMNYVYDPKVQGLMEAGDPKQNITGIYYIPPVKGAGSGPRSSTRPSRNNPLIFPSAATLNSVHIFDNAALNNEKYQTEWNNLISGYELGLFHRHKGLTPYLLLAPGMIWLTIFFVVPLGYLAYQSLQSGNIDFGYAFTWAWGNYWTAIRDYRTQFIRSIEYAGMATVIALVVSYPVAYWIAFRGGRWKNLLLLFIVAPFFVTYLIRTLAWETILSDHGFVVHTLQSLHVLGSGGRLLATGTAVVAGITYNFLPFMALPLYVSLEQVDPRLIEAAEDLYANKIRAFLRVTLPLSLPGVVAGTLLTFIPAAGDFINAQLLGGPNNHMIGNVIESQVPRAERLSDGGRDVVHPHGRDPGLRRDLRVGRGHGAADGDGAVSAVAAERAPARRSFAASIWTARQAACPHRLLDSLLRLPDAADRGGRPLLVQQPGRQVQLHLAGLHVEQLALLERRSRNPERDRPLARDRVDREPRRDGARHDDRARARALQIPLPRGHEHPDLPAALDAGDRPRRLAADALPQFHVRARSASGRS